MTRYNDPVEEGWYGDFDEQMHDQLVTGYREGVDRVLWFLNDWDDEGQLIRDIRDAIKEGII